MTLRKKNGLMKSRRFHKINEQMYVFFLKWKINEYIFLQ
jgi:hypothetical protein